MKNNNPDKKLKSFLEKDKLFLEDLKQVDVEQNWQKFIKSLSHNSDLPQTYGLFKRNRFYIRIAAAFILLLLTIGTFYVVNNQAATQIVKASTGSQTMELKLSDGTAITLNAGTTLTYPDKYKRRKREVSLEGEAFFQVEHADKIPFYIYMDTWRVKVLGTSFNLKVEDKGNIELSVVQGTVLMFEEGKQDQAVKVSTGERWVINTLTGKSHTRAVQSENYLFWKTSKLTYKDESLAQVFGDLELHSKQKIIVTDPLILQNRWTSTHEGQEINEILAELCLYFNLELNTKNDTIFLEKK